MLRVLRVLVRVRIVLGLWLFILVFGSFAEWSAVNGDTRDATDAGIAAAVVLVFAVLITRWYVRKDHGD